MLYKYFKNGNIHIKYEFDCDDYRLLHTVNPDMYHKEPTLNDLIAIICNSMLDVVNCEMDYYYSYSYVLSIVNHSANDTVFNYLISQISIQNFFDGKWIILRAYRG